MFGNYAFSRKPFAGQSAEILALTATENVVVADTSTQTSAFLQSLTENSSPASVQSITAQFTQSVTENTTSADSYATYFAFLQSLTEPHLSLLMR